jgi:hypothetical protein
VAAVLLVFVLCAPFVAVLEGDEEAAETRVLACVEGIEFFRIDFGFLGS